MSKSRFEFVWYELAVGDMAAAEAFYTAVVGWDAADPGHVAHPYTIFSYGDAPVAGLMTAPEGVPPGWTGYIGVADIDDFAERVRASGGSICRPPFDVPNVGRIAIAADPHGAVFGLFSPTAMPEQGDADACAPEDGAVGHVGWRELHAGNGEEAFAFYSSLFGWKKRDAMDMGADGVYQLFGNDDGSIGMGAMMTRQDSMPGPLWNFYFGVDNITSAIERVAKAGGTITNGPMEVPGGMWIANAIDPQGVTYSLMSANKSA